jgi:hypothetical protein
MSDILKKIHASEPRRKPEVACRLVLIARHRNTMVERDLPESFMQWDSLAGIFGWNSGPSVAAFCRKKLQLAMDDSDVPVVNLLAPLTVTISAVVPQLSDSSCSV